MASAYGHVLAAQYHAGASAAKERIKQAKLEQTVRQAKLSLKPYKRTGRESDAERASRLLCHFLPVNAIISHLEAIEGLEAKVTQLELEVSDLKTDLADRHEEAREDVKSMDRQDEELEDARKREQAAQREVLCWQIVLASCSVLAGVGGALSHPADGLAAVPIVAFRMLGVFVLVKLVVMVAMCVPAAVEVINNAWGLAVTIRSLLCSPVDDSARPAHELAPHQCTLSQRIQIFYEQHCPEKLDDPTFCDRIATKYSYPGGEDALFANLQKRYKSD